MVLTIASLIFLIMIGLGGTNANNNYLSNLYFLQANTKGVMGNPDFTNNPANEYTDPASKSADNKIIIQSHYTVALWNYCAGSGDNVTRSALAISQNSAQAVDFCTGRKLQYYFPFKGVWGLSDDAAHRVFGDDFERVLNNYQTNSARWMSTLYIMAVVACAVEILVGIGGLFSRLGSLFTTLSALLTTALLFAFSLLTTLTYFGLSASGNVAMRSKGIEYHIGPTMYVYMWLSVACSLVAGLFWAFSSCCCSGRPRGVPAGKTMVERTPYTYERVDDGPYGSTQTVTGERNNHAGAYEPFRHGQ